MSALIAGAMLWWLAGCAWEATAVARVEGLTFSRFKSCGVMLLDKSALDGSWLHV